MSNGKDKIPPEVQQVAAAAVEEVKAKQKHGGSVPAQPVRFKATDIHGPAEDPEVTAPAREAAASKIIEDSEPDIDLGHEATRIDNAARLAAADNWAEEPKVKVSDLKSADEVHAESMAADPEYAALYRQSKRWYNRFFQWLRDQQGPSI